MMTDPKGKNGTDGVLDSQSVIEKTSARSQLIEAISKKDHQKVLELVRQEPALNLNYVDQDELSPLQHACHIGDVEIARVLINNGADVNFTRRKDGYTPLMFAAISARAEVVKLLLERGVDITPENRVNRTAAQMAAFVGQSKIVTIISSWISYEKSIEPYTRKRELEEEPRIKTRRMAHLIHNFIVFPSYHPVKFLLYIKQNIDLIKNASQIIYVLDDLCSKSIKPPLNNESLSLKYHYLSYILQAARKASEERLTGNSLSEEKFDNQICNKAMDMLIRKLIRRANQKDPQPLTPMIDRFVAECLYKYPYTQLAIYRTSTYALGRSDSGDLNAYPVLIQSLDGPRMFGHSAETCFICLQTSDTKKCSRCKQVYYCSQQCQQADWFQHKKVCKSPEKTPLLDAVGQGGS